MAKPSPKKAPAEDVKLIVDELLAQFGIAESLSPISEAAPPKPTTQSSWGEAKKKPRVTR